jgi:hypothetical protein
MELLPKRSSDHTSHFSLHYFHISSSTVSNDKVAPSNFVTSCISGWPRSDAVGQSAA